MLHYYLPRLKLNDLYQATLTAALAAQEAELRCEYRAQATIQEMKDSYQDLYHTLTKTRARLNAAENKTIQSEKAEYKASALVGAGALPSESSIDSLLTQH